MVTAFGETLDMARQRQNWHRITWRVATSPAFSGSWGGCTWQTGPTMKGLGQRISGRSPYLSLLHAGLGALQYEWNDLEKAGRYSNTGLELARLWNQWEALVPLTIGLARLRCRAGLFYEALELIAGLG